MPASATSFQAFDDIAFEGPLFNLIDKDLSDKLSGWHALVINLLLGLVTLHVVAIVFYQQVRKTNLVLPMLTGKKQLPPDLQSAAISRVGVLRITLTVLIAISVVWGVWHGDFANYLSPQASYQVDNTHKT